MITSEVKKVYAQIEINSTAETVWKVLTGEPFIYQWCKGFSSFSFIESSWGVGDNVTYISTPGVGLIGRIKKRTANAIVIEYIGMLEGGATITENFAEPVKGKGETYTVDKVNDHTVMLTISADADQMHFDTMQKEWNTALDLIKQIAETLSERSIL